MFKSSKQIVMIFFTFSITLVIQVTGFFNSRSKKELVDHLRFWDGVTHSRLKEIKFSFF